MLYVSSVGMVHSRDIDGLGQTTVGGTDVTMLERDKVTGHEFSGFDFLPSSITLNLGLGGKGVHESLDGVSGVTFLNETDSRVDQKQKDNTDEVLPIWGSTSTVGESDSDNSGTFHDPGKGVPHEGQELEEDADCQRCDLGGDSLFLLLLKLVGSEDFDTSGRLGLGQSTFVTLKKLEDFFHDDVLDIDLVFVVQVVGGELDLRKSASADMSEEGAGRTVFMSTLAC